MEMGRQKVGKSNVKNRQRECDVLWTKFIKTETDKLAHNDKVLVMAFDDGLDLVRQL